MKEEIPKPKAKAKSRAKPKIKITKEAVVETVEPIVEEPEPPKQIYELKQIAKCPDCNMGMTVQKGRGIFKAIKEETEKTEPVQQKPKITEDIVNYYIKQNHGIVSTYLRNERAFKSQKTVACKDCVK